MSNSNNSFEPGKMVDELISFVRSRTSDLSGRRSANKPNEHKIEIAILASLAAGSKNAADLISAIALANGGTWVPESGDIHRALLALTEAGSITSKNKSDRRVYAITTAGSEVLAKAAEATLDDALGDSSGDSMFVNSIGCDPSFLRSASKLPPVLLDIAQTGTRAQQARAAEILENTRHQLHQILAEK